MRKFGYSLFSLLFGFCLCLSAVAGTEPGELDPIGYWQITDGDGKAHGVVRTFKAGKKLYGEIVKIAVKKGEDPCRPRCKDCRGWMKNQPICGILLIRNLQKRGAYWEGGKILDPSSGKSYRCWVRIHRKKGKRILEVHGYIGFSFLGKSQFWPQVDKPKDLCAETCRKIWQKEKRN